MDRPDSSDSMSTGMTWASRVTALGLEFALPALGGIWLDRRWALAPLGVIAGAVLGFTMGMVHLLKISKDGSGDPPRSSA